MKQKRSLVQVSGLIILLILVGFSNDTFGQRNRKFDRQGRGLQRNFENINADISEEDQAKIKEIRTAHFKENQQVRNLLAEKRAHLKTLLDSDEKNDKEVDQTIDEIAELQADMMKLGVKHREALSEFFPDGFPGRAGMRAGVRGQRFDGRMGRDGRSGRSGRGFNRGLNPNCPYIR